MLGGHGPNMLDTTVDRSCGQALTQTLLQADAVFMSPPWGGPAYLQKGPTFDVARNFGGMPVGLSGLIAAAGSALRPAPTTAEGCTKRGTVALFLPRNSNLQQIAAAVPEGAQWEVEHNVLNEHLKGITLYVWL